jgi:hypothetical protein
MDKITKSGWIPTCRIISHLVMMRGYPLNFQETGVTPNARTCVVTAGRGLNYGSKRKSK